MHNHYTLTIITYSITLITTYYHLLCISNCLLSLVYYHLIITYHTITYHTNMIDNQHNDSQLRHSNAHTMLTLDNHPYKRHYRLFSTTHFSLSLSNHPPLKSSTEMSKVAIIGAGAVGSTAAYAILLSKVCDVIIMNTTLFFILYTPVQSNLKGNI